jgi:2-polyprenyl-3-methyl-5-hydroxy-6-metoxy-1,4-benzoquinol methylase
MDTASPLTAQYQRIQDVLDRNGNRCTPEEFRQIVNVVFHRYESVQYDEIHRSMWESLPGIFNVLATAAIPHLKSDLRLLDVGCGTGLSTTLLLHTPVGPRIAAGVFVDTSEEMIRIARGRSRRWGLQSRFEIGTIADVTERFDLVLVSSVMHHIPDLGAFLKDVTERLTPGGLFIHLQDPNGEANRDVVDTRKQELSQLANPRKWSWWDRIKLRLWLQDRYIQKTNQELLRRRIILQPLSDEEIWSITDIHDDDRGISLNEMTRALDTHFRQVKTASYAFYGKLASDLPEELRSAEARLLESGDMNGTIMCGVWRRN